MAEGYIKAFQKEKYDAIKAQLLSYRLDPFIRDKESEEGSNKGLIFPFARGLRFSALLIYSIRESLSGSLNLEVNWGQIVDEDGLACSGECDIIIHKKGHANRWNGGNENHIMDFRFIEKNNAVAVISCKSYLTKTTIEKIYCEYMLKYVKRVWLFAECCGPESVDLIKDESKKIGYENFWYLYTWSKTTSNIVDDEHGWHHFIETIKSLK